MLTALVEAIMADTCIPLKALHNIFCNSGAFTSTKTYGKRLDCPYESMLRRVILGNTMGRLQVGQRTFDSSYMYM